MNRKEIANFIVEKLELQFDSLRSQWTDAAPINYCFIDNLLPQAIALKIRNAYPAGSEMKIKQSLREVKYVAAQMNEYNSILEEALYAFQDPRVVGVIGRITSMLSLEPDEFLYAGGISMMTKGHFLNPHLDNSHDKGRERYRVLNLLYYVSPTWTIEKGGNLELWPKGVDGDQITIESKFNRFVLMITNTKSWHSVSPVVESDFRCCVSNYYFSSKPADTLDYFHVTSFRGRPGQVLTDIILRGDGLLRMLVRRLFPKGATKTKHFYKKDEKS